MKRFVCFMFLVVFVSISCYVFRCENLYQVCNNIGVTINKFSVDNQGETIEIDSSDYNVLLNKFDAEVVREYEISDRKIIEGYSNKLKKYKLINNRKINFQISITDEKIIMGYPLISGSF